MAKNDAVHFEFDTKAELRIREYQLSNLLATIAFTAQALRQQPNQKVNSHDVAEILGDLVSNTGLDGEMAATLEEIKGLEETDGEDA